MNNYIFYQLLDRELPRAINDASDLVFSAKNSASPELSGIHLHKSKAGLKAFGADRTSITDSSYPYSGDRSVNARTSRVKELALLRHKIGQLSVAYAISEHEAFASHALHLLETGILDSRLVVTEDWYTSYSFESSDHQEWECRLSIVEIILAIELLRGLGKVTEDSLTQFKALFRKRLNFIRKNAPIGDSSRESFGWALECVVLALFLNDDQAMEAELSYFKGPLTDTLHRLFASRDKRGVKRCGIRKLVFCSDCYFATAHWLKVRFAGINSLVRKELDQLEQVMTAGPFDEIRRGAWVPFTEPPKSEVILRGSSILLISGHTLHRTDLIDSWLNAPVSSKKGSLMTQPLLWFGAEDWAYPFIRCTSSRRPLIGRI